MHAAVAIADRLGMASVAPVILKDSNHTIVHLAPFPVVARVITSAVTQDATARLARELQVAQHT